MRFHNSDMKERLYSADKEESMRIMSELFRYAMCFGCIFALIAVLGCGAKGREVQRVLDQISVLESYEYLHGNLDSIDLRSCPSDFQEAVAAYKSIYAPAYIEYNIDPNPFMPHAPRTLSTEEIKQNERKAEAWKRVETVALRYGAQKGMHHTGGGSNSIADFFKTLF